MFTRVAWMQDSHMNVCKCHIKWLYASECMEESHFDGIFHIFISILFHIFIFEWSNESFLSHQMNSILFHIFIFESSNEYMEEYGRVTRMYARGTWMQTLFTWMSASITSHECMQESFMIRVMDVYARVTLQHTATHCNTLQQSAMHNRLRHTTHVNQSHHTYDNVTSHSWMYARVSCAR